MSGEVIRFRYKSGYLDLEALAGVCSVISGVLDWHYSGTCGRDKSIRFAFSSSRQGYETRDLLFRNYLVDLSAYNPKKN